MSKVNAADLIDRDLRINVYHVYVIENTKTGGKHVSVRKNITVSAFWSLLKAGSRDQNFNTPIHMAIREAQDQNSTLEDSSFSIRRVVTYTSKVEAQEFAAKLIESHAHKAKAYNAQRPAAGSSPDFKWASEEESARIIAELAKAERLAKKQAKTKTVKPAKVDTDSTENGASA
jgi:hypothetical protein